jgi:hypothetical protein
MDFSDLGKRIEILRFLPRKLALSRRKLAEGVKRRQRQACFAMPVSPCLFDRSFVFHEIATPVA